MQKTYSLEELKSRIDIGKMYLNHIALIFIAVGAGSFSMIKNDQLNLLAIIGLATTCVIVYYYFIILNKIKFYLDSFKNLNLEE